MDTSSCDMLMTAVTAVSHSALIPKELLHHQIIGHTHFIKEFNWTQVCLIYKQWVVWCPKRVLYDF